MRDSGDYPKFARNYFVYDPKEVEILRAGFTELRGCTALYKTVLQVFGGLSYPTETTIAIGFNVCVLGMVEDGVGMEWLLSAKVVSRHAYIWCAHISRAVPTIVTAPFLDDLVEALLLFPDVPAVDSARLLTLRNLIELICRLLSEIGMRCSIRFASVTLLATGISYLRNTTP